jgi:hypothetical protein
MEDDDAVKLMVEPVEEHSQIVVLRETIDELSGDGFLATQSVRWS